MTAFIRLPLITLMLALVAGLMLLDASPASPDPEARAAMPTSEVTSAGGFSAGDVDCDGDIDVVDAVRILRSVASLDNLSGCGSADVDCSKIVDAVDALALLRGIADLSPLPVPTGCPGVDLINVIPLVEINDWVCEPAVLAPGQLTECRFAASSHGSDHSRNFDFADGLVQEGPPASSASCPPGGLPCDYASSGTFSVTFASPGIRTISITACAADICKSASVSVTVVASE